MTQMFPEELSAELRMDIKRGGEIRVYDALANLKGDWLVMYSVPYMGRHKTQENLIDGEIDFLIGHPNLGFLILEVKGGDPIEREGRSWYSYSQSYERYEIKDPFTQAMISKNLLMDALKEDQALKDHVYGAYFCQAVCFPDTSELKGRLLLHEKQELMLFSQDLDNIQEAIERVFAFSRGNWTSKETQVKNLMNGLKERYSSHAAARRSGREIADRDNKRTLELTEQQYFILKFLENQDRVGIQGCPGSGKTLLALEKACQAIASGRKTLLICFNKPLGNHLLASMGIEDDLMTGTFHSVMLSILIKQLNVPEGKAQAVLFQDGELLEMFMDHEIPQYDTIIVDEAQDFSETKLSLLELLLTKEGQFYLFYDRNQNLTGNVFKVPDGISEFPLDRNHRNSRAVGEYLRQWTDGSFELDPGVPQGLPVTILKAYTKGDVDQLLKILGHTIRDLKKKGFDYGDITVLTLGSSKKSSLKEFYLQGVSMTRFGEGDEGGLTLDSVKRYKGLESPIVIITETETEDTKSEDFRRKMASAISRAVTQVLILPATEQEDFFQSTLSFQNLVK